MKQNALRKFFSTILLQSNDKSAKSPAKQTRGVQMLERIKVTYRQTRLKTLKCERMQEAGKHLATKIKIHWPDLTITVPREMSEGNKYWMISDVSTWRDAHRESLKTHFFISWRQKIHNRKSRRSWCSLEMLVFVAVSSPRGALLGQAPQIEIWSTTSQWSVANFYNVKPSPCRKLSAGRFGS